MSISKFATANRLMKDGKYEEALDLYRQINSEFPELREVTDFNVRRCRLEINKQDPYMRRSVRIGVIGWAAATGNGAMCSDIVRLMPGVSDWLAVQHPHKPYHEQYLQAAAAKRITRCRMDEVDTIKGFLDRVDCVLYVENPCVPTAVLDVVEYAKKNRRLVVGVPMWEWWPEKDSWALKTDMLWSVTKFTRSYLEALSTVLLAHGVQHSWAGKIFGSKWGVDSLSFPFQAKNSTRFAFVNGNGGYKGRKGLNVVLDAFEQMPDLSLTVYSQVPVTGFLPRNVTVRVGEFGSRVECYENDDIFIFPSFWEGLCHGIYEAQSVGGVVITTDAPPMNECGSPFLISVNSSTSEMLENKQICKVKPDVDSLISLCRLISSMDMKELTMSSRANIETNFVLQTTLCELETEIGRQMVKIV